MAHRGNAHGQGVIAPRSTARADADAHAHTHKQGAQHRSQQRMLRQLGPEGIKLLAHAVEQGEAAPSYDRIGDKFTPQQLPAQPIAECVQDQPRQRRRQPDPMVQEQRHTQHAALRHTGQRMDVVQAKGKDPAAQQSQRTLLWL